MNRSDLLTPAQQETILTVQRALLVIAEARRTVNTLVSQQQLPVRSLLLAEVGMAHTELQQALLADELARAKSEVVAA